VQHGYLNAASLNRQPCRRLPADRAGDGKVAQQIPVEDQALFGFEIPDEAVRELAPDLAYRRLAMVNVVFFGRHGGEWVLIDAGLPGTAAMITGSAAARFGADRPPAAIVLTHGHIDHVGALRTLAERWKVPVYAHPLEHPYVNGTSAYPKPDPAVGGGAMSRLAPLFPRGPLDVSAWLRPLVEDGTMPCMPGWSWIHTPGHSVGHISLWREADRTLIAGDAFITTAQESAYAVAVQEPELHGPPMYFTADWQKAAASVCALATLEPETVVTGHGHAMRGPAMRASLHRLAADFERVAVPESGAYTDRPAKVEDGTAYPGRG
jgi:glyoxylase-like metal-dependent hydrolase (beta-lactamase superfamily II)